MITLGWLNGNATKVGSSKASLKIIDNTSGAAARQDVDAYVWSRQLDLESTGGCGGRLSILTPILAMACRRGSRYPQREAESSECSPFPNAESSKKVTKKIPE